VIEEQPSAPTARSPRTCGTRASATNAIDIERAQPCTPTLTETAAVARGTTAARDYLVHVGHEQAQQTRSSPNERNVCSDVNRATTVGTDKCYHLGTDGTANDDNREHLVYVEHEPSQQRNHRKAYSVRNLPDHLLKNSYLYNTTLSEVSTVLTGNTSLTQRPRPLSKKPIVYSTGFQGAQRHENPNVGGYFTKQEHSTRAPVPFNQ